MVQYLVGLQQRFDSIGYIHQEFDIQIRSIK